MALGISGAVDTGVKITTTVQGNMSIFMTDAPFGQIYGEFNDMRLENHLFAFGGTGQCPEPDQASGYYELWITSGAKGDLPVLSPVFKIRGDNIVCQTPAEFSKWSDTYAFSQVTGPYRLGVHIESNTPAGQPDPSPMFWSNYRIVYFWYLDETSSRVTKLGPVTITQWWSTQQQRWGGPNPELPPHFAPSRGIDLIGPLDFGGHNFAGTLPGQEFVRFTGLQVGSDTVDTSELPLPTNNWTNGGAGTATVFYNVDPPGAFTGCFYPYHFSYDIDVRRFGDVTTGARVFDSFETIPQLHTDGSQKTPQSDFLVVPFTRSYDIPVTKWETHTKQVLDRLRFDITPGWAASQDPPMEDDDRQIPIWANIALMDPAVNMAGTGYNPIIVNFPPSVSVEYPQGPGEPRISHWQAFRADQGTVTETLSSTVFHVTDPSVVFQRKLVSSWRIWTSKTGIPPFGPFPRGIDAYEITKHRVASDTFAGIPGGDDIWEWSSYAYIEVSLVGQDVAPPATLQIDGVWLEVNDSHTLGSDRANNYQQIEHPFSLKYTLTIPNGPGTQLIDLLFPFAGGFPSYVSRVDKLTISGLPLGNTTLNDIKLVTRGDGYFKVDYGPPVQRKDYSCLHASQDGSFPWGCWPDEMLKPDETGSGDAGISQGPPYGGALRFVEIRTSQSTGDIQDIQYSLPTMIGHWQRMEFWQVTYDAGEYNRANTDIFGHSLGPEIAQWLRPIVPHIRYTPGTPFQPVCGPTVRAMQITNAHPFVAYTRWSIWGAIEALLEQDGHRAPGGVTVSAIRTDTNAVVQTGVSDPFGYVVVTPIPANGTTDYVLS